MVEVFEWLKNLFSSQEERNNNWTGKVSSKDSESDTRNISIFSPDMVEIIHVNPNAYLASRGARICIGKPAIDSSFNDRLSHLGKVMDRGHESVSEHTNSIVLIKIPHSVLATSNAWYYSDFLSSLHYCHVSISADKDGEYVVLLVGGSVRAWLYSLREMLVSNVFKEFVKYILTTTFEKCFLKYAINHNLINEADCNYYPDGHISLVHDKITAVKNDRESRDDTNNETAVCDYSDPIEKKGRRVDLVYESPLHDIYDKVKQYNFTIRDVYRVATVSLLFHHISRTCSHQLVRHRNGISQESQRYVTHDYNKITDFVDPIDLTKERYDDNENRAAIFEYKGNLDPFKVYKYMISNKVLKEDARAWLPSNVTTQLLMTMTYENFGYFLKLRMDKAAQKEIQLVAEEAANKVVSEYKEVIDTFIKNTTTPLVELIKPKLDQLLDEMGNTDNDEIVDDTNPAPTLKIETEEDAARLLQLQDKYNSIKD